MNLFLKAKYSFISALAFFIVANPETYKFTQYLFSLVGLSDVFSVMDRGCVSPGGLLLHTFLFFGVMLALMVTPATSS
jgi:hypothetical protein